MRRAVSFLLVLMVGAYALVASGCYSASIQNDGNYRWGKSVSEEERAPVRVGVEAMEEWLASTGDIQLRRLSVEVDDNIDTLVSRFMYYHAEENPAIVAQWFVAGGALASGDVVYLYAGPEWEQYEDWQKSLIAAHEVFHVAQFGFLYDDWFLREDETGDYPPPWLVEGGADYAAARALDSAGIREYSEIRAEVVERARGYPLSLTSITTPEGESAAGEAAPYAVGFLAVEELAAAHGEGAPFAFWDALATAGTWRKAFESVFHGDVDGFVATYDRERGGDILKGGVRGRLLRENGEPVPGATVAACLAETLECQTTWTADDGEFVLALAPGTYEVMYRVATRESVERGMFEKAGVKADAVLVGVELVDGLEATVRKPL